MPRGLSPRCWLFALPLGIAVTALFFGVLAAGWQAAQRHELPVLHRSIGP